MRKPRKPALLAIAAVQVVSAALAWRDLGRRSEDQVRGKKNVWRTVIAIHPGNSLVYWAIGWL
jgi:hypothetical protein